MTEVPTTIVKKIQALTQIATDLRQGKDFNITRLTLLKGLCEDANDAAAFALYIAKKTQQTMKVPKGSARSPSKARQRYRRLVGKAVRRMTAYLKSPTEEAKVTLDELRSEIYSVQDQYERQRWGSVRLIKSRELLTVETALDCLLQPWASSHLGYRLARLYVERYDSRYGAGLNGRIPRFQQSHDARMRAMARYECSICGYVYDEDQEEMRWDALPEDWVCLGCGSSKDLFTKVTAEVTPTAVTPDTPQTNAPVHAEDAPVPKNTSLEPTLEFIHSLARDGLDKIGHHGPMGAMGVPRPTLPQWDDIQILPAQLARKPLGEDVEVGTELVIGPNARKPLRLEIPIFVSDMSFGALSEEAKIALAKGAEMASTAIASGEGGMLPEENAANSRYMFELGSAKFGYTEDLLPRIQAFHFKAGQAAKTGTGGHLPGSKVTGKIAAIRRLPEGHPAVSPPSFTDLTASEDFRRFADRVRELTGGIPIGMKLSAQHIEEDIDFALRAGVDYIILDGRGGATGATPLIFRDNIAVPTIPALARARRCLDRMSRSDITLIITGGLRTPADFIKALCLGANGIAVANAALQAIGCVAARICNTNNCPSGIATQREELRARLNVEESSARLTRFLTASVELMKVMARACGHTHLSQYNLNDTTTWKREMAELTGIKYTGVGWSQSEPAIPSSTKQRPKPEEKNSMSTQDNL